MSKERQDQIHVDELIVKLNQDTINQVKTLSLAQYGEETTWENVIQEALAFYYSYKMEEAKKHELANYIESEFFQRLDAKLEGLYLALAQNSIGIANHNSDLLLKSVFETSVIHLLMHQLYCSDEQSQSKYEELRQIAGDTINEFLQKDTAKEHLDLYEKIQKFQKECEILQAELSNVSRQNADLKQKYELLYKTFNETKTNYTQLVDALKSYYELTKWHERRVKETPAIRKKNSGLLKEQTWESALEEFEAGNSRPRVPNLNFK